MTIAADHTDQDALSATGHECRVGVLVQVQANLLGDGRIELTNEVRRSCSGLQADGDGSVRAVFDRRLVCGIRRVDVLHAEQTAVVSVSGRRKEVAAGPQHRHQRRK
jgi:hypothetical protein